jgi:hypothetical protein
MIIYKVEVYEFNMSCSHRPEWYNKHAIWVHGNGMSNSRFAKFDRNTNRLLILMQHHPSDAIMYSKRPLNFTT